MGFNTSMIVMNDAVHVIRDDPTFGKNVADAICKLSLPAEYRGHRGGDWGIDVSSRNHATAATVIESHHADYDTVIAFGGNRGLVLSKAVHPNIYGKPEDPEKVKYLRAMAEEMGFTLRRKPKR